VQNAECRIKGERFDTTILVGVGSRCGSVTLAFCRRTVAAFIALVPLRYPRRPEIKAMKQKAFSSGRRWHGNAVTDEVSLNTN